MNNNKKISIYEMILRDGLQSLPIVLELDTKILIYKKIILTGISNIEFGSTTSSKLLTQMKDSFEFFDNILELDLNLNLNLNNFILCTSKNGLINSINKNIKNYSLVYSLCDIFGIKNLKKTFEQSFNELLEQLEIIKLSNFNKIRIYISSSFGSIFTSNDDILIKNFTMSLNKIYQFILDNKIQFNRFDIVFADTFGLANENDFDNNKNIIKYLELVKEIFPSDIFDYISLHLHLDNSNTNIINNLIDIGLNYSIKKYDSSICGIGGCPFGDLRNLKGNISTSYLVKYLNSKGFELDIDLDKLELLDKDIHKIIFNK